MKWNGTWIGLRRDHVPPRLTRGWCVYYLMDASGEVLYIGTTGQLGARLRAHRGQTQRTNVYESVAAVGCADQEHAAALEAAEIRAYQPPLNIAGLED